METLNSISLSLLITKKILSYIIHLNDYTSLKVASQPDRYDDDLRNIFNNRNIVPFNYILVCKQWFKIISSFYNQIYWIRNKLPSFNQYSVIQNDLITHLFINSIRFNVKPSEFIERFKKLQRVVVHNPTNQYIRELVKIFGPNNIKLEVYFDNFSNSDGDLRDIDDSILKYTYCKPRNNISLHTSRIDYIFETFVETRRLNGINISIAVDDENGFSMHTSYQTLFNHKHLKDIKISGEDYVDLKDLHFALDRGNIESLYINVAFGVMKEESDDDEYDCNCKPDIHNRALYSNNNISYWKAICNKLEHNTILKRLHIPKYCRYHKIMESIREKSSSYLANALSVNRTLEELTISCQLLSDDFYNCLSTVNRSIKYLKLHNVRSIDIPSITKLIMYNTSINHLYLYIDLIEDDYYVIDEIMSTQLLEALSTNQTLTKLTVNGNNFHNLISTLKNNSSHILTFRDILVNNCDKIVEINNINLLAIN